MIKKAIIKVRLARAYQRMKFAAETMHMAYQIYLMFDTYGYGL